MTKCGQDLIVEGDTSAGLSLAGAVARIATGSLSVFGFVVPQGKGRQVASRLLKPKSDSEVCEAFPWHRLESVEQGRW